jgi:4-aminobutyrate aminotransferase
LNGSKPSFDELIASRDDILAPCLAQDWPNMAVDRAEGVYVFDSRGKAYLDFLSGFGACNLGHNHPKVMEAARSQMERMVHAPVGVTTPESTLRLAWELGRIAPGGANMFFFGNSGGEAVDASIKLARYVTGRPGIIAFIGGFHGRTMGAASVTTSKAKYRRGHLPLIPEVYFARFPYPFRSKAATPQECADEALDDIDRLFEHVIAPEDVAAFLVEPVQGEGGYVIPPQSWMAALRQLCDRHGILLIMDEVQTGFGRTGELFAARVFDVEPDIICMAKGIANGFPLGAIGARRELMKQWGPVSHGTTYGGSPISCAAGLAVLQVIQEENLLANACKQGEYILGRLRDLKGDSSLVGDVRGIGLMIAVEFVIPGTEKEPNTTAVRRILDRCLEAGLLVYPCGHWTQTIRLIPPLNVTRAQVDEALNIFAESVLAEESYNYQR